MSFEATSNPGGLNASYKNPVGRQTYGSQFYDWNGKQLNSWFPARLGVRLATAIFVSKPSTSNSLFMYTVISFEFALDRSQKFKNTLLIQFRGLPTRQSTKRLRRKQKNCRSRTMSLVAIGPTSSSSGGSIYLTFTLTLPKDKPFLSCPFHKLKSARKGAQRQEDMQRKGVVEFYLRCIS